MMSSCTRKVSAKGLHGQRKCLQQMWFSAADFQFFLVTPPLLYALHRRPRLGAAIMIALMLASTISAAAYAIVHEVGLVQRESNYIQDVYNRSYFRISTYLMGMLLGFHFSSGTERSFILKTRYVWLGWSSCTFALPFAVFGLWLGDAYGPIPWHGAFMALSTPIWVLGIMWILYASLTGCGELRLGAFVASLRSTWQADFAVYVVHYTVINIFYATREESLDYNHFLMGYLCAGNLLLSFALSVILCLFIEMPMLALERLILGPG
ncbi:nose resistant to fluoxetine protein 6-like [Haemaphysalis longicornis]